MPNFNLFGRPGGFEKTPRHDPQTQQVLSQLLGAIAPQFMGGQQGSFEPIRQRATSQYKQEILPAIAERYAGQKESGAYQGALARSGTGLAERLAGMESQFNLQRQGQLANILGMAMMPRSETAYRQESPGFLGRAGSGLMQGLGMAAPYFLSKLFGRGGGGGEDEGGGDVAGGIAGTAGTVLGGAAGTAIGGPIGGAVGGAAGGALVKMLPVILRMLAQSRGSQGGVSVPQ